MKFKYMLFNLLHKKGLRIFLFLMFLSPAIFAQPKPPSTMSNPLAQALVLIMVLLALAIAILANVVNNAVEMFRDKLKEERKSSAGVASAILVIGLCSLPGSIFAQMAAAEAPAVSNSINGLSPMIFYLMVGVIAVEVIILIALVYQLRFLIGLEKEKASKPAVVEVEVKPKTSWWWKLNKSKDISEEQEIDLSHDYDGISELDNKLPPWWTVAFAITIVFAIGYLYRYHVSHSAPLQIEELQIAMQKAEVEKTAYLAKSANNVDENSVVMLGADGIAAGKTLFAANCIACHGNAGEGNMVGPNLTDNYWLHGGSINEVFKTIKYGWPEKGMQSWKENFSPVQIAQLASYIETLKGTNPPNAREPQGELIEEKSPSESSADSTTVSTVKL